MKYAYVLRTRARIYELYESAREQQQQQTLCSALGRAALLELFAFFYLSHTLLPSEHSPRFDSSPGQSKHCLNLAVSTARFSALLSLFEFARETKIILLFRNENKKKNIVSELQKKI